MFVNQTADGIAGRSAVTAFSNRGEFTSILSLICTISSEFFMAACDQGYLCDVCGEEVTSIRDSDLYLRFVTGQLASKELLSARERHLMCNPIAAQFIDAPPFHDVAVDGAFSRHELDEQFVSSQVELLTRGWNRLQELAQVAQTTSISDYPLPEFRSTSNEDAPETGA